MGHNNKKLNFNAPQSVLYQNIFEQFQIWKSYIFILKQTWTLYFTHRLGLHRVHFFSLIGINNIQYMQIFIKAHASCIKSRTWRNYINF